MMTWPILKTQKNKNTEEKSPIMKWTLLNTQIYMYKQNIWNNLWKNMKDVKRMNSHLRVSTAELGTDYLFFSSSNLTHHHSLHPFQHVECFNLQLQDQLQLMSSDQFWEDDSTSPVGLNVSSLSKIPQKPHTTTTSTLVDSLQGCKPNISWWPVGVWESGATTGAGLLSTQQAKPCGAPLLYTGAPLSGVHTQAGHQRKPRLPEYLPKNIVCNPRSRPLGLHYYTLGLHHTQAGLQRKHGLIEYLPKIKLTRWVFSMHCLKSNWSIKMTTFLQVHCTAIQI